LPEKIRKIFDNTPRMAEDNLQEHCTRVMALYAQHSHKIATAKFEHPNKVSEEDKQKQWEIAVAKAKHEEEVFKAFIEDENTTTEAEKTLLEKVATIANEHAEWAMKSTAEKWA
jgi:hypothetical protein